MKKLSTLAILIAVAGLVSINAYAHNHDYAGFGGFSPFGGFGYGFSGYGMNYSAFGGFGGYGMGFDSHFGFSHEMAFDGHFGGGFGGFDFNSRLMRQSASRKIVPIPATASVNTSISYDENGEIHVRPFDDEDLFVED